MQTTAMVLAEIIASGELQTLARPGADIALRRPISLSGACRCRTASGSATSCCTSRASSCPTSSPTIPRKRDARLDEAIADLRSSIDALIDRGDVAHGGEHREVLETFRMFAHDQGWLRRLREAHRVGPDGGGRRRARPVRQPRQDDAADRTPICASGCTTSTNSPTACCTGSSGRDMVGGQAALPENAILVARSMGPAALLDYDRSPPARARAGGGRARPATSPSWRARWASRPSATSRTSPSLAEAGDAIIVDGGVGQVHAAAAARRREPPSARRRGCAPAGRSSTASCATSRRDAGRRGGCAAPQCRPAGRPAACRGDGRARHRPVPHRAAVHDRRAAALDERAARALPPVMETCGRDAGHVPHARHRRRQGAALYAAGRRGEPGAGLARDPHRPRPAGPAARTDPRHAEGGRRARDQDHVPDDRDGGGIPPGEGAGGARERASRPPRLSRRPSTSSSG